MANKVKALQQWCKIRCDGYRDVEITNFTSSWKSGLAFCAIIHRYRPDLIDYDSLKKDDTYGNSKLAFDVALHELSIAALLDPEDMVAMKVPDKLCIITYVAQYYNYFHNKEMLGGPGVKTAVKRPLRMTDLYPSPEPKKNLAEITNTSTAVAPSEKQVSPAAKRRTIEDRCCMCQGKVYLLERHYSGGKLYHRHCCREAERSSTFKQNKENGGPRGDKKENLSGGRVMAGDAEKTQLVAKAASATPTATKTSLMSITKSLFVPGINISATSGVDSEGSKVPADTPKATATASSAKLSPFVPTATSSASNPATRSTPNYLTTTAKSSSPGPTTTISSKWSGNRNSILPAKAVPSNNTPKTSSNTTTTTAASSIFAPSATSALGSGSKWTPSPVSAAVTSSSSTSKYTSIFASRTTSSATPGAAGSASTVQSTGFVSTITTTVSGQAPSNQAGLKDITFTVKYGDSKNAPTTVSSASGSSNRPVASTFLVSKSPTALGSGSKGATEALKSGEDASPKAEWQLEAEKRQKMRNGGYVDPEKYPQRNYGAGVTVGGQAEKERDGEKKETESKKDTARASARQGLVTILQRQLKVEPSQVPSTVTQKEDSKVPVKEDEMWVIVERSEYDDVKPSMARAPAFRVTGAETASVVKCPLSHGEVWKKVVEEGNIGFLNTDKPTEPSRPSFESSPPTLPKQIHKIENPNVPKRKVNAEEKVSVDHINKKLVTLDQQLRVVEGQGRKLEDKIRGETDEAMDEDEEEVMIEWFALVKQKYELVREESDLMYRRRQQELEELHEELEYQYRCMISKPDDEKTYDERKYEKELLDEIVEIVKLRDNIVNSIEVDRQRYLEEDEKIKNMMEASGINDSGKVKKKRRKNKKKQLVEKKGGTQNRKVWFKRPSFSKSPTAKDIE